MALRPPSHRVVSLLLHPSPTRSPPRTTTTSKHTPLLPRAARRAKHSGWLTVPPRDINHQHFMRPVPGLPPPTTGPAAALARREQSTPVRTGVLAEKKGVSALYTETGRRIPCTILQMDQVQVLASRTFEKHGYWAVQVGSGQREAANTAAPQLGYYEARGVAPKRHVAEFRVRGPEGLLPTGAQLLPDWFRTGQYVDARSNSRGMGFAGGMKRHGFGGQPASHGNSKTHRHIGSAGPSQGSGSRVHPGKKMPGRMGNERVTVQNLRVLKIDNDAGVVVIHGHVAGPRGCMVKIADAIKKKPPSTQFVTKTRQMLLERNPGLEARLESARVRHLELKQMRKEGTIGAMLATDGQWEEAEAEAGSA